MGMRIAGWMVGTAALWVYGGGPVTSRADSSNPPLRALMESDRRFLEQIGPPPVAEKRAEAGPRLAVDEKTVSHFLQAYVRATGQPDAAAEASYFAGKVDYFDRGTLGAKALKQELVRARRESNPTRTWMGLQTLSPAGKDAVKARFTVWKGNSAEPKSAEVREAIIQRLPSGGLRMTALHQAPPPGSR